MKRSLSLALPPMIIGVSLLSSCSMFTCDPDDAPIGADSWQPLEHQSAVPLPSVNSYTFASDSTAVVDESVVTAHAQYMQAHPDVTLTLIGHADERGSEVYNQSLGYKRAQAVKVALIQRGIDGRRIDAQSRGESAPISLEHNPAAWRINRRVEFIYSLEKP